jgi:hypothetical protein
VLPKLNNQKKLQLQAEKALQIEKSNRILFNKIASCSDHPSFKLARKFRAKLKDLDSHKLKQRVEQSVAVNHQNQKLLQKLLNVKSTFNSVDLDNARRAYEQQRQQSKHKTVKPLLFKLDPILRKQSQSKRRLEESASSGSQRKASPKSRLMLNNSSSRGFKLTSKQIPLKESPSKQSPLKTQSLEALHFQIEKLKGEIQKSQELDLPRKPSPKFVTAELSPHPGGKSHLSNWRSLDLNKIKERTNASWKLGVESQHIDPPLGHLLSKKNSLKSEKTVRFSEQASSVAKQPALLELPSKKIKKRSRREDRVSARKLEVLKTRANLKLFLQREPLAAPSDPRIPPSREVLWKNFCAIGVESKACLVEFSQDKLKFFGLVLELETKQVHSLLLWKAQAQKVLAACDRDLEKLMLQLDFKFGALILRDQEELLHFQRKLSPQRIQFRKRAPAAPSLFAQSQREFQNFVSCRLPTKVHSTQVSVVLNSRNSEESQLSERACNLREFLKTTSSRQLTSLAEIQKFQHRWAANQYVKKSLSIQQTSIDSHPKPRYPDSSRFRKPVSLPARALKFHQFQQSFLKQKLNRTSLVSFLNSEGA